jgi:hypothetical protein
MWLDELLASRSNVNGWTLSFSFNVIGWTFSFSCKCEWMNLELTRAMWVDELLATRAMWVDETLAFHPKWVDEPLASHPKWVDEPLATHSSLLRRGITLVEGGLFTALVWPVGWGGHMEKFPALGGSLFIIIIINIKNLRFWFFKEH